MLANISISPGTTTLCDRAKPCNYLNIGQFVVIYDLLSTLSNQRPCSSWLYLTSIGQFYLRYQANLMQMMCTSTVTLTDSWEYYRVFTAIKVLLKFLTTIDTYLNKPTSQNPNCEIDVCVFVFKRLDSS